MRQPSNLYTDGSGPSRILAPGLKNFISAIFNQDHYALDAELNLNAWLQAEAGAAAMREQIYSGFSRLGTFFARQNLTDSVVFPDSGASGYHSNRVFITPGVAWVNGYRIDVRGNDTISIGGVPTYKQSLSVPLAAPPASGSRDDIIFLEAWFQEVGPTGGLQEGIGKRSATVYQDGHVPGFQDNAQLTTGTGANQENLVAPLSNDVLDPTVAQETTGRVQLCWRIRTVSTAAATSLYKTDIYAAFGAMNQTGEGIDNASIYAIGNNSAPQAGTGGAAGSTAYPFTRALSVYNSSYNSLYGDDYGLLVAGTGTQTDGVNLGTVDGFVYALPIAWVHRRNSGGFSIGTTNNPNGAVKTDSTFALNGNISAGLAASATYRFSDRADGKFADIIELDDIIDMRHQVFPAGVNRDRLLAQGWNLLLTGQLNSRDVYAINQTTPGAGNNAQAILNRYMIDQLATGATLVNGAIGTDSNGSIAITLAANTGSPTFAETGTTSLPIRRYYGDAPCWQRITFTIQDAGMSGASSCSYTLQLPSPTSGLGSPEVIWASVDSQGNPVAYNSNVNYIGALSVASSAPYPVGFTGSQGNTGNNYGGPVAVSGLGTSTLTISGGTGGSGLTSPNNIRFRVSVLLYFQGRVGALTALPLPTANGLAGQANTYQPIARIRNLYSGDPYGDWMAAPLFNDPRSNHYGSKINLPPGYQYKVTGGKQDQFEAWYPWCGVEFGRSPFQNATIPNLWAQGQGTSLTFYFNGNGTTSLTIGNNGNAGYSGLATGTATLYNRTILWVQGAPSGQAVTPTTQQINADGSITVTFSGVIASGTTYGLVVTPDVITALIDPRSRAVVDFVRPQLINATMNGTDSSAQFWPSGVLAGIATGSGESTNTRLVFSNGGSGSVYNVMTGLASTSPQAGVWWQQALGTTPTAGTIVKAACWTTYTPTASDQIVLEYVASPYQGRALDMNGGTALTSSSTGPVPTQVYYVPPTAYATSLGTGLCAAGAPWPSGWVITGSASTSDTSMGGLNAEVISTLFGPQGQSQFDGALVGDSPHLDAPNNLVQPWRVSGGNLLGVIAPVALREGEVLTLRNDTGSGTVALRGWSTVAAPNILVEELEGPLLPQSSAEVLRPFLVVVQNRLYLAVAEQLVSSATSSYGVGSGGTQCAVDLYELPGRPLIKQSAQ